MKLMYLIASAAMAMAAEQPPVNAVSTEELPEVEVVGKQLWQMRQDIIKAEDHFYSLYNELNSDHDFDIACSMDAPLGTRLKQRVCKVHFMETAEADYAQAILTGGYAPQPVEVALVRQTEFRKKALAVINASPDLLRLVRQRDELEKRYLAARKERFKGHWAIFEKGGQH